MCFCFRKMFLKIVNMCFTQSISLVFSIIGFSSSFYFYKIKKPFSYYIHGVFYSTMELLQFIQYFYINQCNTNININLTYIAYILIWLQPLLFNYYYLLITNKNKIVFIYNIYLSFIIFLLSLDRVFIHFLHPHQNRIDEIASGITCTYSGSKHLYWNFDMKTNHGIEVNYLWYVILICFPALWIDNIKKGLFIIITFLSGLMISNYYTQNMNETIPFWCVLSIPYLMTSYIL